MITLETQEKLFVICIFKNLIMGRYVRWMNHDDPPVDRLHVNVLSLEYYFGMEFTYYSIIII